MASEAKDWELWAVLDENGETVWVYETNGSNDPNDWDPYGAGTLPDGVEWDDWLEDFKGTQGEARLEDGVRFDDMEEPDPESDETGFGSESESEASGHGEGTGEGSGQGTDAGSGEGDASGDGTGTGDGEDVGTGEGTGTSPGPAEGDGTGEGTEQGEGGEGNGGGDSPGNDGYDDALQNYLDALGRYEEALGAYEDALSDVEGVGGEMEGLAGEAEGLGGDLEGLGGDAEDAGEALQGASEALEPLSDVGEELGELGGTLNDTVSGGPGGLGAAGQAVDGPGEPESAGDPVSLATGAYLYRQIDAQIPAPGFDLAITRHYCNQAYSDGSFGLKWDTWLDARVRRLSSGTVYLWTGQGRGEFHTPNGDGTYDGPFGLTSILREAGSGWALEDPDGVTATFGATGWLTERRDRFGNGLRVTRDGSGRATLVRDDNGRSLQITRDAAGRITAVTDPLGRAWGYAYDGAGRLSSVTTPGTDDHPSGAVTRYEYQDGTDPRTRHNLVGIVDAAGTRVLTNTYGSDTPGAATFNRVVAQTFAGAASAFDYEVVDDTLESEPGERHEVARRTTFTDSRGVTTEYEFNVFGSMLSERVLSAGIRPGDPGEWRTTHRYDALGHHSETTFPSGARARFRYDTAATDALSRHRLTQTRMVASGSGSSLTTSYTHGAYGQVAAVTSPDGSVVEADLDARGLAVEVRGPAITLADGTVQQAIARYTYNTRGQVERFVSPEGHEHEYTYFETGARRGLLRRTALDGVVREQREYDTAGRLTAVRDALGNRFTREYDTLDRPTLETAPAATGTQRRYAYDLVGNCIRIGDHNVSATGAIGTPEWIEQTMAFDAGRRLIRATRPLDAVTSATYAYTWDGESRITSITDPGGLLTRIEYDERGLLYRRISDPGGPLEAAERWDYGADGGLAAYIDPLGASTTIEVDAWGRPAVQTDALGTRALFTWDAASRLTAFERLDAAGVRREHWRQSFDALGRLYRLRRRVIDPDGNELGWLDDLARYDAEGRAVVLTDAGGRETAVTYDGMGLPLTVTDAIGNVTTIARDANGAVESILQEQVDTAGNPPAVFIRRFTYDAMGRPRAVSDGLGNVEQYARDSRGLIESLVRADGSADRRQHDHAGRLVRLSLPWTTAAGTGRPDVEATFSYDAMGRLTAATDPRGQVTRGWYDALGRLERVQAADGGTAAFVHDAAGNLLQQTDPRGVSLLHEYDALHRLVRRTATLAADVEGATTETFAYDAYGTLASATTGADTVRQRFDSVGRLWSESLNGRTVSRTFGTGGLPRDLVWPSGFTVRHSWDDGLRLSEMRVVSSGTAFPGGSAPAGALYTADYLGETRPSIEVLANGVQTSYWYDAAGRPLGADTHGASALESLLLLRDGAGRVTHRLRDGVGATALAYDSTGWLGEVREGPSVPQPAVTAWLPSTDPASPDAAGTQAGMDAAAAALDPGSAATRRDAIAYDAAGNRTTVERLRDGVTETETYAATTANRYSSVNGASITYDAAGNVTSDGTHRYRYDYRGRLVRVLDMAGAEVLAISYDALGRAARLSTAGESRTVVYNGLHPIAEYREGTARPQRLVVFGDRVDQAVAVFAAGQARYLHTDQVGTVLAQTDETGAIAERYRVDEFGRVLGVLDAGFADLAASSPNAAFQGRPQLWPLSDAYDFRARSYRADWGRFLQPDPLGVAGGLNVYLLGANNPVLYIDPTGEIPVLVIMIAAGAIIGGLMSGGVTALSGGSVEDVLVATLAGAAGGALMATGGGVGAFVAGGAAAGLITGAWEGHKVGGWEGAAYGAAFGTVFGGLAGGVGGVVGTRVTTSVTARMSNYASGAYVGVAAGGALGGGAGGGINGFGMGVGTGLAGGEGLGGSLERGLSNAGPGVMYGAAGGAVGAVGVKGVMQAGLYAKTRTLAGVHGEEGEFFVRNSIGQEKNSNYATPQGKIPDFWGAVRGEVKNTARVPSLSKQNNQLRSFMNAANALGDPLTLYTRPGVTAGPRSQVGRAAGQMIPGTNTPRIVLKTIPHWAFQLPVAGDWVC